MATARTTISTLAKITGDSEAGEVTAPKAIGDKATKEKSITSTVEEEEEGEYLENGVHWFIECTHLE